MNTDNDRTNGMLTRRFKFIALSGAVIIFVVFTLAALWFSLASETRAFRSQTLRTTQQINEKVTSAIAVSYTHLTLPTIYSV